MSEKNHFSHLVTRKIEIGFDKFLTSKFQLLVATKYFLQNFLRFPDNQTLKFLILSEKNDFSHLVTRKTEKSEKSCHFLILKFRLPGYIF